MVPRTPLLTVDIVVIFQGKIVLVRRRNPPYQGCYALPGGFVEVGERVEDAAIREAGEETGLDVRLVRLLGVYSDPERDPRGHTVSIVYLAVGSGDLKAGSDAESVGLFSIDGLPASLAFDHARILQDAAGEIKGCCRNRRNHCRSQKGIKRGGELGVGC